MEGGVGVQSAIVIVAPEIREEEASVVSNEASSEPSLAVTRARHGTPLVCVEVLGRSVIARLIDEFGRAGFDSATQIDRRSLDEAWGVATQQLLAYRDNGATAVVIVRASAYIDLDLRDLLQFHREQRQVVTRAFDFDEDGEKGDPLDVWVVDPSGIQDDTDLLTALHAASPARYFVQGYVNRLTGPADLRRLVVDGLIGHCRLRPQGTESRPGVWMDEGAQVHKDARIVAPVFIGRGARISEQCLITRCSSIESNCHIDYGTVVEDSSILPNSYVGIGLDLSHSIVDGNNLLNLERGVTLEIADPCVIRQNKVSRQEKSLQTPFAFGFGSVQFAYAEEGSR
jgi:NDP-sugar pyrophosphorylase family protein